MKHANIAIIGRPNVGKSTFLNSVLGHKLSIVTHKSQTTRNIIKGIATIGNIQFIFMDTPGIFDAKRDVDKFIVKIAWSSIRNADVVLLLLDVYKGFDAEHIKILKHLTKINKDFIVAINKCDNLDDPKTLLKYNQLVELINSQIIDGQIIDSNKIIDSKITDLNKLNGHSFSDKESELVNHQEHELINHQEPKLVNHQEVKMNNDQINDQISNDKQTKNENTINQQDDKQNTDCETQQSNLEESSINNQDNNDLKNDLKMDLYPISGLFGKYESLLDKLKTFAIHEGWLHSEDEITTLPFRFLAEELTREKILLEAHEEVPYNIIVKTENIEENNNEMKIWQVIKVLSESHKKIIIGHKGNKIKKIGENARLELQKIWERKIHLFLHVQVRKNLMDNPKIFDEN